MVLDNGKLAYYSAKAVRHLARSVLFSAGLLLLTPCGLSTALWGLDCLLLPPGPHLRARCDVGVQSWDIGKPPQKGLFIPVMFYQLSPSVCH